MIDLFEYKRKARRLSDYVQWCTWGNENEACILDFDGAFQQTFCYRGADLDAATKSELVVATAQINNCLRRVGGMWVIQAEAQRIQSKSYPDREFPDICTALIDSERKAQFSETEAYFESVYYFTVYYLPPAEKIGWFSHFFIDKEETKKSEHDKNEINYKRFKDEFNRIKQSFEMYMPYCRELTKEETLEYLHSCVANERHIMKISQFKRCGVPEFISERVCTKSLIGGLRPKLRSIDTEYIGVISITALMPESTPAMLDALNRVGFPFRWTTRFIAIDKVEAESIMKDKRRQWMANRKTAFVMIKEAFFKSESAMVDTDAINKYNDAQQALEELADDCCSFGYMTQAIVVTDKDNEVLNNKLRYLKKIIEGIGFDCIVETTNAVNAWLGTIPVMPRNDIRRHMMSSINLCHFMPMSSVWTGDSWNKHLNAPPLMRCKTSGSTPFWLNIHVGDVGHTMVVGPTGSGKSVLLNTIEAQFRGYKDAQIYIFDKGGSSRALTAGVGGTFYDLGAETGGGLSFQPLAKIDDENERNWALEWILEILSQEGFQKIMPQHKAEVWSALNKLATAPEDERTMTGLCLMLQDEEIRAALQQFTTESAANENSGAYGKLFDNDHDSLSYGSWQTFEMEELMAKKGAVMPTLLYIFHRLEKNCTGKPTIFVLDECWTFLDNPLFAAKIREWLRVMRKNNVSIIFATQNLEDVAGSTIAPVIIESCKTRIFLPNQSATNPNNDGIYKMFNLNETERQIIATAVPKRSYYLKAERNSRLFELGLEDMCFTLAYVASASKEDQRKVKEILANYPADEFNEHWVKYKGMDDSVVDIILELKYGKIAKIA